MKDAHKQAEVVSRTPEFMAVEGRKPFRLETQPFVYWATVNRMLETIGLAPGSSVLDVGSGTGWSTLFLAEMGYEAVGIDLVPVNVALGRERAQRWRSPARFELGDMDDLPDGERFDAALVIDALHHTTRQSEVVMGIGRRVRPGGWVMIGEPSALHWISPGAYTARRDLGWLERGVTMRSLRRDLDAAGFRDVRRFFQPTDPYTGRVRGFAWQLLRLVGANLAFAPHALHWVVAQRGD